MNLKTNSHFIVAKLCIYKYFKLFYLKNCLVIYWKVFFLSVYFFETKPPSLAVHHQISWNVRKQKKAPVKFISSDLTPSSVVSSCPPDLYDVLVIHGIINSAFLSVCTTPVSLILLTLLILQRNALKPLVKHDILE